MWQRREENSGHYTFGQHCMLPIGSIACKNQCVQIALICPDEDTQIHGNSIISPGADVRLRIMMWPMRGPKASQKEPMAIREKHVPAIMPGPVIQKAQMRAMVIKRASIGMGCCTSKVNQSDVCMERCHTCDRGDGSATGLCPGQVDVLPNDCRAKA